MNLKLLSRVLIVIVRFDAVDDDEVAMDGGKLIGKNAIRNPHQV